MSAGKNARRQTAIINRGIESKGSVGGDKNAGLASTMYWKTGNGPLPRNFPGCLCNATIEFALRQTTRHPFQRNRRGANPGRGLL